MTQPPVTVTYTLEEVLGQLHQKLDRIDTKVDDLRKEVDTKFDHLQADIVEIKTGQIRLETEIKGDMQTLESQFKGDMNTLQAEMKAIGKRLDTQEFINRSVLVGLVLAVLAGILQIFLPRLSG